MGGGGAGEREGEGKIIRSLIERFNLAEKTRLDRDVLKQNKTGTDRFQGNELRVFKKLAEEMSEVLLKQKSILRIAP